jgi:hypothetical protein
MNALVFRTALRATARVACTAAVVGCGGTVSSAGGDAAKSPARCNRRRSYRQAPPGRTSTVTALVPGLAATVRRGAHGADVIHPPVTVAV